MSSPTIRLNSIADALLLILLILPWWWPLSDGQLWVSLPREALAASSFACVAILALARHRGSFVWPPASHALAALAIVPVVQWALGLVEFRGDAALAAMYMLGAAALCAVGANDRRYDGKLASILLNALLVAACGSATLAIFQWIGVYLPELWLASASGGRSAANLGQPNLLATLMVWGLVCIWRLYAPHQHKASLLPGALAFAGATTLLLGIATTQSRAGALGVLVQAVLLVSTKCRRHSAARTIQVFWCMALAFLVIFFCWEWISAWITTTAVSTLEERSAPGTRPLHWRLAWDAIAQRPWGGWGWLQVSAAQWMLANTHPHSGEILQYSHDLVLDLLIWNGIPLGALLSGVLLWWLFHRIRQAETIDELAAVAVITALLLHSLFEFPHAYVHFLWAGALLAGSCVRPGPRPSPTNKFAPAGWISFLVLTSALSLAFLAVLRDMNALQQTWEAQRFYSARIGPARNPPQVPAVWLLDQLQARVIAEQVMPSINLPESDLQLLYRVSKRYPSAGLLVRLAWAEALMKNPAAASNILQHLCRVHTAGICVDALQAWESMAREQPAMRAVVLPTTPTPAGAKR